MCLILRQKQVESNYLVTDYKQSDFPKFVGVFFKVSYLSQYVDDTLIYTEEYSPQAPKHFLRSSTGPVCK